MSQDEDRDALRRFGLNEEGVEMCLKAMRESGTDVYGVMNLLRIFGTNEKYERREVRE